MNKKEHLSTTNARNSQFDFAQSGTYTRTYDGPTGWEPPVEMPSENKKNPFPIDVDINWEELARVGGRIILSGLQIWSKLQDEQERKQREYLSKTEFQPYVNAHINRLKNNQKDLEKIENNVFVKIEHNSGPQDYTGKLNKLLEVQKQKEQNKDYIKRLEYYNTHGNYNGIKETIVSNNKEFASDYERLSGHPIASRGDNVTPYNFASPKLDWSKFNQNTEIKHYIPPKEYIPVVTMKPNYRVKLPILEPVRSKDKDMINKQKHNKIINEINIKNNENSFFEISISKNKYENLTSYLKRLRFYLSDELSKRHPFLSKLGISVILPTPYVSKNKNIYDAIVLWNLSTSKFTNNLDYILNNGILLEDIYQLPLSLRIFVAKKIIKTIKQSKCSRSAFIS